MEQVIEKKKPSSLSDYMRIWFKWILDPIGGFLNRLGLMPNTVTILGLIGNTVGAVLIARGQIFWGGVLILLMGPVDAVDGTMARLRKMESKFGAFVDSVTDRYTELVILAGLLYFFLQQQNTLACMLTYFAAAGSVLVSYTKARAEALGYDAKIGVLTRVERYLVLAPLLLANQPLIAMWIISILSNVTALQRILFVRKQAHQMGHVLPPGKA